MSRNAAGIGLPCACALAAAFVLFWPVSPARAQTRPEHNRFNVLFIAIDDLRPELGCYGAPHAQSPNLDRFAESAVVFTRHYVQVPTCGASRYALLTGRSPRQSGATSGNHSFYADPAQLLPEQLAGAQSLPERFRRSGYATVCIGKVSHTPDGRVYEYDGRGDGRPEMPHAWDEFHTPFGPWKRGWGAFFAYAGGRHREDGGGHRDLMEFTAAEDASLPDGLLAESALGQIRRFVEDRRRFFIGLGFFKPHLPFVATVADWAAFEGLDDPVSAPLAGKPDSSYWHRSAEFHQYAFPFPRQRPLPPRSANAARTAYRACVRYTDRQVGKVLDALDASGIADETIVVVWGDHGWHLGEQEIWGKHSPFERALRSVLMIRVPGLTAHGRSSDALVESLDVYPTLVELCNPLFQQTAHPLDGVSVAPVLRGESPSVRDAAISYWQDAVSIREPGRRTIARIRDGNISDVEAYDMTASEDGRRMPSPDPATTQRLFAR